ncbi:MAG: hypothetical protein INR66_03050 [Gordonia polyisoprenivorans]|nr:hypothetical protein [Gordonia polyisoprenivorans]
MSTNHIHLDPDALTVDGPNLTGVAVVAATRGISKNQAREQLLAEWDERLVSAINAEAQMATDWLAKARDHTIAHDLATAALDVIAAQECHAAMQLYQAKREQCAAMRRMNREHPQLGDQNYR